MVVGGSNVEASTILNVGGCSMKVLSRNWLQVRLDSYIIADLG